MYDNNTDYVQDIQIELLNLNKRERVVYLHIIIGSCQTSNLVSKVWKLIIQCTMITTILW